MKILLLLTLAITLVGCGNSKNKNSNNEYFNRYQDALQGQKAGLVLESNRSGFDYDIDFDDETKLFSVIKETVKSSEREVILRVEGDKIYKYVEHTYNGFLNKSVVLESIALESKRTEEIMKLINFNINEDRLVGTLTMEGFLSEYDTGEEVATISGGQNVFLINLNINNILCDSSTISTSSGQTFTSPTSTQKLDTLSTSSIGICPAKLSRADLKKIDLKKIEFCDESKETDEYNCEDDQDMSFITEEL